MGMIPSSKKQNETDAYLKGFREVMRPAIVNQAETGLLNMAIAGRQIAEIVDSTGISKLLFDSPGLVSDDITEEYQNRAGDLYKEKMLLAKKYGVGDEVFIAETLGYLAAWTANLRMMSEKKPNFKPPDVEPTSGELTSIFDRLKSLPNYTDKVLNLRDFLEGLKSSQLQYSKPASSQPREPGLPPSGSRIQFNRGGMVYASNGQLINFQPKGTDTVPAMLTPGEFVINKASTQKHLPVLQAINSGSYSHGDIVKQFNKGGAVLPNYYMNGNSVSSGTNSNSFDFGSFMRELMGQLSSVLTESIRKAYDSNNQQKVSEKSNGVSIDKSILDSINTFTNRLKSVADILAGLNAIPSEIRITGQHDVNVIINGDSVLRQLNPDIQQIVMTAMKDGFQKLINNNSPVPADKLINPFNIEGPTQL
jgi:hypothetical protein